jgi:molybdopterin synthase catalytic subunit
MKAESKKEHKIFVDGEILPSMISESIANHSEKKGIGAHSIFLGQVRNDEIDGKKVSAIEYSCYAAMAEKVFKQIRESAFSKYDLSCLHIHHSLGKVNAGKISLFVFASSVRRKNAIQACNFVVDELKSKAPVWGKEIFEDDSYKWKVNS